MEGRLGGGAMSSVGGPAALVDVAELRGHEFLQEPQQRYHDDLCALANETVPCEGNREQRQLGPDSGGSRQDGLVRGPDPMAVAISPLTFHVCMTPTRLVGQVASSSSS